MESRHQNFTRVIYKKSNNSLFPYNSAIPQWFIAPKPTV